MNCFMAAQTAVVPAKVAGSNAVNQFNYQAESLAEQNPMKLSGRPVLATPGSGAGEFGGTFFEESIDAFLKVGGGAGQPLHAALKIELLLV